MSLPTATSIDQRSRLRDATGTREAATPFLQQAYEVSSGGAAFVAPVIPGADSTVADPVEARLQPAATPPLQVSPKLRR